jgi:rubrerythrin
MASLTWFAARPGPAKRLTGQETREEILRDAIRRENEIIVLYQGLKDFARDPASEDTIDRIIKEVNRHIHLIMKWLHER